MNLYLKGLIAGVSMSASRVCSTVALTLAAVITAGPSASAQDLLAPIACGDVIRGMAQLKQHLLCDTSPGLTVKGQLDMNGFTLTCDGTEQGIVLAGRRSGLQNGDVEGCVQAVVLAGRGRHEVVRVRASGSQFGFLIESRSNRLVGNNASSADNDAFRVAASSNFLVDNKVDAAGDDGFDVRGRKNTLTRNVITGVVGEGIDVSATRNVILGNTVIGAGDDAMQVRVGGNRIIGNSLSRSAVGLLLQHEGRGDSGNEVLGNIVLANKAEGILVSLSSEGNRIIGNEVQGNGTDLLDRHPDCVDNLWAGNVFNGADPAGCIR
jgi:parallel beta-helix repeat protein